jgi:hypothetical protein
MRKIFNENASEPPANAERCILSFVPGRFFDDTTHTSFLANKVGYFWRDRDGRRMGLWRWESANA